MGVFTFTERRPAGVDANYNWYKSCCSKDGRIVYVCRYNTTANGARLYRSVSYGDGGWTQINPTGTDVDFDAAALACSDDGSVLLIGSNNFSFGSPTGEGRLYISTDFGTTCSEIRPAGDASKAWYLGAVSGDGTKILMGDTVGRLYSSAAPFSSFTERRPDGDASFSWYSAALSYDGSIALVGHSTAGAKNQYLSTDTFANWSDVSEMTGSSDQECSVSSNGAVQAFCSYAAGSTKIFLSTDTGSTYAEVKPTGGATTNRWRGLRMSSDGKKILAVMDNGRAWFTSTQGASEPWTELRPAGDADNTWRGVGMSSRGDRIFLTSLTRFYSGVDLDPTAAPTAGGVGGGLMTF